MNTITLAILLGIIQGLTEFFPVSSSGHLILFSWIVEGKPIPMSVNVALHMGTMLAVFVYFSRDWTNMLSNLIKSLRTRKKILEYNQQLLLLIIGSIPAAIVGVIFKETIEEKLHAPLIIAFTLIAGGLLLWMADRVGKVNRKGVDLSAKEALLIGIGQTLALIPGVSRSGSTITVGRLLSLSKAEAARFSFLLGTPAMVGAALLHMSDFAKSIFDPVFYVGVFTSFLVGMLAIKYFMILMGRISLGWFALYRIILALIIILCVFLGKTP